MAKIKVEAQTTGAGIYTVKSGTSATSYTATLPDATGTILMTDGDGSSLTGITHTPADNSVTLAKMAHGTDGELITYDAAGAPANVAVGTSGHILTSGGAGVAPTFQAAAGGGKVLQVVQTHLITTSSTSTPESLNTYVNITDLNASIIPLTGSKVRITIRWNGSVSNQLHGQIFGIRRGSAGTVLGNPASAGGRPIGMCNLTTNYTNTYAQHSQSAFYSFVDDSPGGDGSTSISYYCISTNGGTGTTVYTNRTVSDSSTNDYERLTSTIILEEIGA